MREDTACFYLESFMSRQLRYWAADVLLVFVICDWNSQYEPSNTQ